MVKFVYTLLVAVLFSCSVKKKCDDDLSKIYLTENHLKVKGTVYIQSLPAVFLLKKENTKETLKLFTPFGKRIGQFEKNKDKVKLSFKDFQVSSDVVNFIKKIPLSLSELLSGKIYKEETEKVYCTEDGWTVLEKNGVKIFIKDGKIRKIKWNSFKAVYSYEGFKISKITIYNKEKKEAVIYLR